MRTNYNLSIVLVICLVIVILTSLFISLYRFDEQVVVTDRVISEKQPMFMMLINGKHNDSGWSESHINGFLAAVSQLNLVAEVHENIGANECQLYVDDFVQRGGNVVIMPSGFYAKCVNKVAEMYPQMKFITTIDENLKAMPNVFSFYGRMYHIRYLSGILAAMVSKSSSFGYVYMFNNSESIRGINAFALGVRKIKPNATVYALKLSNEDTQNISLALDKFYDRYPNIKTFTYHLSGNEVEKFCGRNFLQCVSFHVNKQSRFVNSSVGSAVWDWSLFYRHLAKNIIDNAFKSGVQWLPVETATAKLKGIGSDVSVEAVNYIDAEMSCLLSGECAVFVGPMYDNKGQLRLSADALMSDEEMLYQFNWFVDGVEEVSAQ